MRTCVFIDSNKANGTSPCPFQEGPRLIVGPWWIIGRRTFYRNSHFLGLRSFVKSQPFENCQFFFFPACKIRRPRLCAPAVIFIFQVCSPRHARPSPPRRPQSAGRRILRKYGNQPLSCLPVGQPGRADAGRRFFSCPPARPARIFFPSPLQVIGGIMARRPPKRGGRRRSLFGPTAWNGIFAALRRVFRSACAMVGVSWCRRRPRANGRGLENGGRLSGRSSGGGLRRDRDFRGRLAWGGRPPRLPKAIAASPSPYMRAHPSVPPARNHA